MKTKTINLYTINELQELDGKGYDNAIRYFRNNNDYMFLSDCMNERLHELLEEKGIIDTNDTSKAGTKPTQVIYSLSCCQGDGAMFEGTYIYTYKDVKYMVKVTHSGNYYHYNSKSFYLMTEEGEDIGSIKTYDEVEKAFDDVYVEICKDLAVYGYDFMEGEDSEEYIKENCEANEYYFTIEGDLTSK